MIQFIPNVISVKSLLERKRVELFDVVDVDGLRMREGGGTETDRPLSEGQKERGAPYQ